MNIDIKTQLRLILEAIDRIASVAHTAGVYTDNDNRYDDWERIIEAIYQSFVADPAFELLINPGKKTIARLGFSYERPQERFFLAANISGQIHYLHDILLNDKSEFAFTFTQNPGQMDDQAVFISKDNIEKLDDCRFMVPPDGK